MGVCVCVCRVESMTKSAMVPQSMDINPKIGEVQLAQDSLIPMGSVVHITHRASVRYSANRALIAFLLLLLLLGVRWLHVQSSLVINWVVFTRSSWLP